MVVVQCSHLLMARFGVDSDNVAIIELLDEGEGVADGGKENVASGFVGLGLETDTKVVPL